jgi:hypothetical protein
MSHTATTRPQPATFERRDDGWRMTWHDDPNVYEVICPDCGDDSGPIELQPAPARSLRGPYATSDEAWKVATAHHW